MAACPWSNVLLGVAWSVWHNERLFGEMKKQFSMCKLSPGTNSTKEDKVKWMKWLADADSGEEGYNIHRLWIWYAGKIKKS